MRISKLLAVLVVLSLLLSPLASFPVQASDPNDPDGDDDNDSDGYDSNQDGEISDEEKYTNLEEYYNNTNPNLSVMSTPYMLTYECSTTGTNVQAYILSPRSQNLLRGREVPAIDITGRRHIRLCQG